MHCSTRALLVGTLVLFGCAHSSAGDGGLSVRRGEDGSLALLRDGDAVSQRPMRIVVQEWKRRDGSAPAAAQPERNTVGSIVESDAIEAGVLEPAGDAWAAEVAVRIDESAGDVAIEQDCGNGIVVRAAWVAQGGAIKVAGELRNESTDEARREVPLTIALAIPVDGSSLRWLESLHSDLDATTSQERFDAVATSAGARGAMSRYPFGAIAGDDVAVAVGLPLDRPRIHRIRWDGAQRQLVAEIDVVVSPDPEAFPNRVPFEFVVFDFAPEFGFRGVAQRYYALNPTSYDVRLPRQGQWMPFSQIDSVQRPEDFAFQFHEYHPTVSVAWNAANGVDSLPYCEPPVQYVNMAAGAPRELATLLPMVEALDTRQGAQIRGSSTRRADGTMQAAWVETPWAVGARIPTNGDPDIPRTARDPWNSFDANWLAYQDLLRKRASDRPAAWSGAGLAQEGVVGAQGRALYLASGERVSQEAAATPAGSSVKIDVVAKASASGQLAIDVEWPGGELRSASIDLAASPFPAALRATLDNVPQTLAAGAVATVHVRAEGTEAWIDAIAIDGIALSNAGFDEGAGDAELPTGFYLDSFEGWDSKDLNFRREHFAWVDIPLTFDARTGQTAQVNMMHSFEFAGETLERLRARGDILMANTALYQWAWSAHYLDVLGIETSWGEGPDISPPRLAEMDYLRTMLWHKPYCYLQNLRYENFRGKKVEQYFARCFHYGFWPGFFSHNAAEAPYWEDPALYNADRPVFLRYMEPQRRLTAAGWEPVTLAHASDPEILCERWGGGPLESDGLSEGAIHFTLLNPTKSRRAGRLVVDPRALGSGEWIAVDLLDGGVRPVSGGSLAFDLAPLASCGVMLVPREASSIAGAAESFAGEFLQLAGKYHRFGFVDAATHEGAERLVAARDVAGIGAWIEATAPKIDAIYRPELHRAGANLRTLLDAATGALQPRIPDAVVPGETFVVEAEGEGLMADLALAGRTESLPIVGQAAEFRIPEGIDAGADCTVVVRSKDGARWFEARIGVAPAVALSSLPERVVIADKAPIAPVLRNNLGRTIEGTLAIEGPPSTGPARTFAVALQPGEERPIAAEIVVPVRPKSGDERLDTVVRFEIDGRVLAEQRVPTVVLAADASLLRAPDVSVRVDSTYYGYGTAALTDGILDTTGMNWADSAWASDESAVPHWIEFEFPRPVRIGEVEIHWAPDGGQLWTSQQIMVQSMAGADGEWTTVATAEEKTPVPTTKLSFDPQQVLRLRVYQPVGKGPAGREGILWLNEVEAR